MRGPGPRTQASWPPVLLARRKTRLRPLHPCRLQVPGACASCAAEAPLTSNTSCQTGSGSQELLAYLATTCWPTGLGLPWVCAWSSLCNPSVLLGCAAAMAHPRAHDAEEQAAAAGTFGVTPASAHPFVLTPCGHVWPVAARSAFVRAQI